MTTESSKKIILGKEGELKFYIGIVGVGVGVPTDLHINWEKRKWTRVLTNTQEKEFGKERCYLMEFEDFGVPDMLKMGMALIHVECGHFQANVNFSKKHFVEGFHREGVRFFEEGDGYGDVTIFMGVPGHQEFQVALTEFF